ncbi:RING finger protein 186 [Python bivittatus]|uniref:RING finger protein 186 n=1 Tax=Python bivittatus TaxID=176946 RepID=A0A9F5IZ04_PYTBI|nr:RING finger protein 186 [Python bivittatus]
MENLQLVNGAGKEMDQCEISEETPLRTDGGPGVKGYSTQEDRSCCLPGNKSVDLELGIPETETSASLSPAALNVLAPAPLRQCPSRVSVAEMDCLICFNRYSFARLPKVLACQHAFCAVCLKLILRNEDRTWVISCPLCRKTTAVFGGLICSLRNQEHVMEQLGSPDPDAKGAGSPGAAGARRSRHPSSDVQSQDGGEINQAATKRLILLLMIVSLLIVLILPFMNTGLLTWSLCFMIVLSVIVSVVLCWDPSWMHPSLSVPRCTRKVNQVA